MSPSTALGKSRVYGKGAHLAAACAAQVLQLERPLLESHCAHQLRLYGRQVIAIAAVLARPLVCLHVSPLGDLGVTVRITQDPGHADCHALLASGQS